MENYNHPKLALVSKSEKTHLKLTE